MAGFFIVLEGIDGSGTTTQARRLAEHLGRQGRRTLLTSEPSGGPVGRLLREILSGAHRTSKAEPFDGTAAALLFAADRRDHLRREVEPALEQGLDVISDRYLLSSLAYQAEEADLAWVRQLARGVRTPELTILVDVPVEVAAARRLAAGRPTERYDHDGTLTRVARNYRKLAEREPGVHVIDGKGGVAEVGQAIAALADSILLGHAGPATLAP